MPKKTKEKITEEKLVAVIDSKKASGLGSESGDNNLSQRRQILLDRYLGELYGDERDGQSKAMSRECLEAVEWTLPSLMRVFASGTQIGEFIPIGRNDEEPAKQESQAINHVFFNMNDGFMTLLTVMKDCLMNPVVYAKVFWDESDKVTKEEYDGLTVEQVEKLLKDPELEVLAQAEETVSVIVGAEAVQVQVYNLELKRTHTHGKICIEPIPPEEIIIDSDLNKVSLEKSGFVDHNRTVTRSELVEMGFDAEVVAGLDKFTVTKDETTSRHTATEGQSTPLGTEDTVDPSTELVEIDEAYLFADLDGDGIAERIRVTKSGSTILEMEETDYMPVIAVSAVPLPHVHIGLSWMELVKDLQDSNTTLTRQFLNNLYRTNNPRPVVGRGVNLNDLVNDLPNAPIRAKDPAMLRLEPTHSVVGEVLPAFDYFERKVEGRTGVSKALKGLDADALSRVTKGAFFGSLEQSNQRIELLARIVAESFVKQVFLKMHRLLQGHQKDTLEAKIGGKWAEVSPTEWRERDNMRPLVGLGTGNKQSQMAILDKIMERQERIAQNGGMGKLVSPTNMFNASAQMIELAELPNAEKYFLNPDTLPKQAQQPQQPPGDPGGDALAAAQMELAKVEREKANLKHQSDMANLQLNTQKAKIDYEQKIRELQGKLADQQRDFMLKRHDLGRKDHELLLNTELEQHKLGLSAAQEINKLQAEANKMAQGEDLGRTGN